MGGNSIVGAKKSFYLCRCKQVATASEGLLKKTSKFNQFKK